MKDKTIAFVFGCVFVIALLALAIWFPHPTRFQYLIFRIVMALAAAGVGSMIPGFLTVSMEPSKKLLIRAGGALALFVIVYFFDPASRIVEPVKIDNKTTLNALGLVGGVLIGNSNTQVINNNTFLTQHATNQFEFTPIRAQNRTEIIGRLKQIPVTEAKEKIKLVIGYEHGSLARGKLAEELSQVLKEGGMIVELEGSHSYLPENFDTPVRVFLNKQGPAEKLYWQIKQAIAPLLDKGIVPLGNMGTATNEIHVQIMGTPIFLSDGTVSFN